MHAQISNLKLQLDSNNISYNKCTCQMENATGITLSVNFLQIMSSYTIRILALYKFTIIRILFRKSFLRYRTGIIVI